MKIDTTQIPNFDALPDDARAAILGMEFADAPDMSKFVEKSVFDKKASEASELSKQLKAKMTVDEQAEAERTAKEAEREARIAELEKREEIRTYEVSYLAMGYDENLARETATALAEKDMKKFFENQQKAAEAAEKRIRDELTRKDPRPGGAGGGDTQEKSEADKIAERIGKERSGADAKARDILSKYIK